jgi:hypothetical protein
MAGYFDSRAALNQSSNNKETNINIPRRRDGVTQISRIRRFSSV